jgi:hypothetical protein
MAKFSMLQLLGGVAAAGVVAAGTTALTGSGVVWGNGTGAGATQFVGGTLTQTVSGATIQSVAYTPKTGDLTGTQTRTITVGVIGADQMYLTLTPSGGTGLQGAVLWFCSGDIASSPTNGVAPKVQIDKASGTASVVCTTGTGTTPGGYYDGLDSLDLAVTTS